ncbi:hypothetical protein GFL39_27875 [Rhizobium leguminosarum bv. viciae]|nr:hypothetical protein [Rhizobium leguminosarum bv. viciae]NKL94504.1 hypothetical protein [Rhizobium leguminosarum bv. viciae]NKM94746.1 hypothetical protein [Rhizobium leguminosarum bv. viciae]
MREVGEERRGRRHGPFAPFTGRRWRQPDEGLVSAISWAEASCRLWRRQLSTRSNPGESSEKAGMSTSNISPSSVSIW